MSILPNTYIPGQIVFLQDVITDPTTGLPVVDASDTVTVYKPDRTTVSPEPTVTSPLPGTYAAQVTADASYGWWEYVWQSSGAGAGASRGWFYVSPVP